MQIHIHKVDACFSCNQRYQIIKLINTTMNKITKVYNTIQYNTIQLYCLYVDKFAFWLVIYIKIFNTVNNKTSTTQ